MSVEDDNKVSKVKPANLFQMFPFDEIRPGQKEFMADVYKNLVQNKIFTANVPTGVGKTAAVLTAALSAATTTTQDRTTVIFLTNRQTQHRIAIDTLKRISDELKLVNAGQHPGLKVVDLMSKRELCAVEDATHYEYKSFLRRCIALDHTNRDITPKPSLTNDYCPYNKDCQVVDRPDTILHVEEFVEHYRKAMSCPYKAAKSMVSTADVIVADYNFIFGVNTELGIDPSNIIVIVDEAHGFADRVRDNFSGAISIDLLENAQSEIKKVLDDKRFQGNADRRVKMEHLLCFIDALKEILKEGAERTPDRKEGTALLDVRFDASKLITFLNERTKKKWQELKDGKHQTTLTDFGCDCEDQSVVVTGLKYWAELMDEAINDFITAYNNTKVALVDLRDIIAKFHECQESVLVTLSIPDHGHDGCPVLKFRLLDVSKVTAGIFASLKGAVLMSGTMLPLSMHGDILGMVEHRRVAEEYASPFPTENRIILGVKGVTSKYSERGDEMEERYAKLLERAISTVPGNSLVFYTSYSMMERITNRMSLSAQVYREEQEMSREEKLRILDDLSSLKKSGKSGVLFAVIGGSFAEGIDFKYNMIDHVAVVGLPYPPPASELNELERIYERKFGRRGRDYVRTFPMLTKVIQCAGRGIRSETDRCAILLLDERYCNDFYIKHLPKNFTITKVEDPVPQLEAFYRNCIKKDDSIKSGGSETSTTALTTKEENI